MRVHPEILSSQRLPADALKGIWRKRFEQINTFERYLVENGIHVMKFFLNVSKEEQKRRFLARIDQPEKNWKFSLGDAGERAHWDEYMEAFEQVFKQPYKMGPPRDTRRHCNLTPWRRLRQTCR